MTAFALPAARSRRPAQPRVGGPRRARPEETLQLQVARFLNLALAGNSMWMHVPNGGLRSATEAKRFKAMGVMAGFPDISVINDGRLICIELKADKGRATANQLDCHRRLSMARVPVGICRSLGEVEAFLRAAGVPLHATLEAPIMRAVRPLLREASK